MNADGSGQVPLTSDPAAETDAACPDGTAIAFVRTPAQSHSHVWLMNANGTRATQLTFAERTTTSRRCAKTL
jgi:Tol biopolymer transport system component